ncbi:hypothetical protein EBV26_16855 [bacterium]|nr:hypothetical protein [bacterium]
MDTVLINKILSEITIKYGSNKYDDHESHRKRVSYALSCVLLKPEYKQYFVEGINHEKISVATKKFEEIDIKQIVHSLERPIKKHESYYQYLKKFIMYYVYNNE